MVDRLVPYLRGGKTRGDLLGLKTPFADALARMLDEAPDGVRQNLGISSAFRSPERQAQLFSQAVAKYGSEDAARKWVAPPGRSKHNHGDAVDLSFGEKGTPGYDAAVKYAHENAGKYGLNFPMSHENWHVEPIGVRGGPMTMPAAAGGAVAGPAAPGGAPVPSMVGASAPEFVTVDAAPQPEPDIAGAFTNAMQAFGRKQAPNASPTQPLAFQPPVMAQKKPDLAKILSGTSAPLTIGRSVA